MAMSELDDEVNYLQQEFDWLLQEEVTKVLKQLHNIVLECGQLLPVCNPGSDTLQKSERFLLTNASASSLDQITTQVTLSGDNIIHAVIELKLHKHSTPSTLRTVVQNDCQWKLQQIQDASNHLQMALQVFSTLPSTTTAGKWEFKSAEEVVHIINSLMGCLQRGRASLIIPKKRTVDEVIHNRNMKSLQPPLPNDLAVSFYVQSHKLVFAVYHILSKDIYGHQKFDVFQAETSIFWLSEALVLFTVSLQLCQQLKDKLAVFTQYKEMNDH